MAQFVEGNNLNTTLENIIRNADEYLFLISPYIKLHDRIKDQLKLKRSNNELQITVVFGKAEKGNNRITTEDAEFLKTFPNIEIRYEKNLHAKYYASEDGALITSLNLYDFSQNQNIEAGVFMETPTNLVGKLTGWSKDSKLEGEAFGFFCEVIENSDLLFKKTTGFESSMFGMKKAYSEPKIEIDELDLFFNSKEKYSSNFSGFKSYDKKPATSIPYHAAATGFCIRTGREIPFDLKMPYSQDAFRTWNKFGNEEYPEKFCHFSGETTNGETCYKKPILIKYWKQAKERTK